MSKHRGRPLDSDAAEQLLRGVARTSRHGQEPLAQVLAAAAAPARPEELAGERTAVDAFLAARATWGAPPRISVRTTAILTRALTIKAVAAMVVAAVGGLVLAAGVGVLPGPFRPESDKPPLPGATQSADGRPVTPSGLPTSQPSASASASPAAEVAAGPGLCKAYLGKPAGDERSAALATPAFQPLVTAAGGADQVDAYCTAVIAAEKAHGAPSSHPTASHPTVPRATPSRATPSQAPHQPTTTPPGKLKSHPSDRQSGVPPAQQAPSRG